MSTYTIPNVISRTPQGERVMDVYSRLLDDRIVYSALVSASGIVTIRLSNPSASSATSNVGSGSWGVLVIK